MSNHNDHVIAAVRATLAGDPRLPAPDEIAVEVFGKAVVLRGTVGSFAQRRAALADAGRTPGVSGVFDELDVRLLDHDRREDAVIRGAVLQRLIWDPEVPADSLNASVKDGWVTLEGGVNHQFQSDSAFNDVARVRGVTGVTNAITVVERVG
jgi:osmotically-inducible protein OsmY